MNPRKMYKSSRKGTRYLLVFKFSQKIYVHSECWICDWELGEIHDRDNSYWLLLTRREKFSPIQKKKEKKKEKFSPIQFNWAAWLPETSRIQNERGNQINAQF